MATTGQTINDRLNAVRYALVGQGLARTVCKATTEEIIGPKKKHIDYLIACTNEPNVSIPQLANLLVERTQHSSWAVVFKSLVTIHHLMSYGNIRFTQYLATSNHSFELADFMDRTTPQGYNMSDFVRRYAKYINDKIVSYRTLAIDLCKIRSGNNNALRTMNMENLSKTLPIVQVQFDSLLDFGADSKDLNNGIIMSAFRLLYKDLVKLYVAYQEAIINLLERYFKLSRKKTREAFAMYKNYLERMSKVAGFLHIVDAVGLDKSEMPDLTNSPASILKLLEEHLAQLEAKKKGANSASPDPTGGEGLGGNDKDDDDDDPKHNKGAGSKLETSDASEGQEIKKEHQPPPKPARPSPKVSPVKATPAKPSPPEAKPGGTAEPAKKATPPERPAKPPSRPPPPSGGASSRKASIASSAPVADQLASQVIATATAAAQTPPPPHPPPPHPPGPSAKEPVGTSAKVTENVGSGDEKSADTIKEGQSDSAPVPGHSTSDGRAVSSIAASESETAGDDHAPAVNSQVGQQGPTCSNIGSEEAAVTEQVANFQLNGDASQDLDANHVDTNQSGNSSIQNQEQGQQRQQEPEDDSEIPPPPPPIEDGDDGVEPQQPDADAGNESAEVNGRAINEGAQNE